MLRYTIPLVLLAVIAAFFYRGLSLNPSYVPSALIGKQMPAFSLPRSMHGVRCRPFTLTSRSAGRMHVLLNGFRAWRRLRRSMGALNSPIVR